MEGATALVFWGFFKSRNYTTFSPLGKEKVVLSSKILSPTKVNEISDHEPVQLQRQHLIKQAGPVLTTELNGQGNSEGGPML